MDWHLILGISAGLIAIGATVPYILSIIRGETRPNVVSWSLWTIIVLVTAVAQISAGASWPLMLLIGSTVANLAVVFLCSIGYGYSEFKNVDKICLFLALAAIVFWWITSNPVIAILLAVIADGIAYIPTYAKTYQEPKSEPFFYWGVLVCADILAVFSSTIFNAANVLFPISYGILNTLVLVASFFGNRRQMKRGF